MKIPMNCVRPAAEDEKNCVPPRPRQHIDKVKNRLKEGYMVPSCTTGRCQTSDWKNTECNFNNPSVISQTRDLLKGFILRKRKALTVPECTFLESLADGGDEDEMNSAMKVLADQELFFHPCMSPQEKTAILRNNYEVRSTNGIGERFDDSCDKGFLKVDSKIESKVNEEFNVEVVNSDSGVVILQQVPGFLDEPLEDRCRNEFIQNNEDGKCHDFESPKLTANKMIDFKTPTSQIRQIKEDELESRQGSCQRIARVAERKESGVHSSMWKAHKQGLSLTRTSSIQAQKVHRSSSFRRQLFIPVERSLSASQSRYHRPNASLSSMSSRNATNGEMSYNDSLISETSYQSEVKGTGPSVALSSIPGLDLAISILEDRKKSPSSKSYTFDSVTYFPSFQRGKANGLSPPLPPSKSLQKSRSATITSPQIAQALSSAKKCEDHSSENCPERHHAPLRSFRNPSPMRSFKGPKPSVSSRRSSLFSHPSSQGIDLSASANSISSVESSISILETILSEDEGVPPMRIEQVPLRCFSRVNESPMQHKETMAELEDFEAAKKYESLVSSTMNTSGDPFNNVDGRSLPISNKFDLMDLRKTISEDLLPTFHCKNDLKERNLDSLMDMDGVEEDGERPEVDEQHFDAWKTFGDEYEEYGYGRRSFPFDILGTSADDVSSLPHVMSPPLMESLHHFLPYSVSEKNFYMKYSLVRDGASFYNMLQQIRASQHTLIGIETTDGEVFGSFSSSPWRKSKTYFGSGEAFLWKMKNDRKTLCKSVIDQASLESDVEVFAWTGKNYFNQFCSDAKFALGGGSSNEKEGGFGLLVENDLFYGSTNFCSTFGNPPLSTRTQFEIVNLEIWTMTAAMTVKDADRMEMAHLFLESNRLNKLAKM
uniref:Oxidation resistance protein 1 n=1 Tax=Chaetoceros debilis TaxID=122233 RepID=A0A7S3PWU6_9STRA